MSVLVHSSGAVPDMAYGISIAPGMETNIQLTQSVRTRLGHPYTNCTDKPYLPWDNTSATYTQSYCAKTCMQQKIVDQCGCVSTSISQYTIAQLREANFRICQVWYEEDQLIDYFDNCNISKFFMLSSTTAACNAACVLPCSELQYDAVTSVMPWPAEAFLSVFSTYYLAEERFYDMLKISENATAGEIDAATKTEAAYNFFKSRFLQLNVQFSSQSFV